MDIKEPLVSVALCTYNGEGHIKELMDSLVQQTYANLEIVIVDDGSTDRTFNMLLEYKSRFGMIRLYQNEKNIGYARNFEKAIALCEGEYIALCDQDDVWNLQKTARLVQFINANVLIYHDSQFIDEAGNPLDRKLSDIVEFYSGDKPEAFIFFNCISSHALMFRRELSRHLFPFPEAGFHDAWIGYVACNFGQISYLKDPLVGYRQHHGSATDILKLKEIQKHPGKAEKYRDNLNFIKRCKDLSINKNPGIVLKLYELYKDRKGKKFSFPLLFFFMLHFHRFFVIYKRGILSKLNFAYKQSRGVTIKEP